MSDDTLAGLFIDAVPAELRGSRRRGPNLAAFDCRVSEIFWKSRTSTQWVRPEPPGAAIDTVRLVDDNGVTASDQARSSTFDRAELQNHVCFAKTF